MPHNNLAKSKGLAWVSLAVVITMVATGCSTISTYDQAAYQQAVNTKVDALTLMGKATDLYQNHQSDVASFQIELQKAYEYERGRPLNTITLKQWEVLVDPDRDLLGGFLKEWKESGRLLPVYVKDKQDKISVAFDEIIQLESGKIKPSSG